MMIATVVGFRAALFVIVADFLPKRVLFLVGASWPRVLSTGPLALVFLGVAVWWTRTPLPELLVRDPQELTTCPPRSLLMFRTAVALSPCFGTWAEFLL